MYSTQQLFFRGKIYILAFISIVLMNSCQRNVLFTSNTTVVAPTSGTATDTTIGEKVIMPDDKILISVWDHNELSVGSLQGTYSLAEENGKWLMVDINGEVRLPQIGTVKLQGLTVREATVFLEKVYAKFIQNPIITLRVLNNKVTILGEVRSPGVYLFSGDNGRLVDLIGNAQGLTDYAKTTKVKLVRGTTEMTIDLTNTASVAAKELTVIPGDVIYIPPTSGKAWDRFANKLIPIASLITSIALVYSITQNNSNP